VLVHNTLPDFEMPNEERVHLAAESFRLLADPTRIKILWALLQGESSVACLADLVGAAALGGTGVFAVLSWQANRGQSVLHPDLATLAALAAVAALTLAAVTAVLLRARLRALPTPP